MFRPIVSLLAVATVVVLTGCSGSTPDAAPEATGTAALPITSPLDEYLGGGGTFDEEAEKVTMKKIEEQVASCMKEAGFTYLPLDPDQMLGGTIQIFGANEQDREWVSTYGYGVSTIEQMVSEAPKDPNQATIDAMSQAEQEAWNAALYGSGGSFVVSGSGGGVAMAPAAPVPAGGPDDGPDSAPPSAADPADMGCFGQAQVAVRGDQPAFDPTQFEDMFTALGEVHDKILADPRLVPANQAWAQCVADAGHPGFTKVSDAIDSIYAAWGELTGIEISSGGGSAGVVSAVAISAEQPEIDQEKLAELRKDEVELALVDLDCRGDYPSVEASVRAELEGQFVADHRQELEQFRDLMNAGR